MRAVRAQDGCIYHISKDDLPSPPTVEALHSVLSEYAAIPPSALIVMHPNGRQADRASVNALLRDEADDSDEGLVYLFDREALVIDLESEDGRLFMQALDLDVDHLLDDVGHDPDKQYDATIDLVQCIRHQHRALSAAISNLERHRGGRQDLITAYQHFASPQLTKYANVLAVYPACMSLVNKVRVSAKMQTSSTNAPAKDRLLSDFVSREKMENVRDGCKRIFDEITRQNSELEAMLQNVATTTENLKVDIEHAYNVDDLIDCEKDANEAHGRLKELFSRPGQRSEPEEDELDTLFDECIGRLRYLVDRRNVETRQLLHSLQEIANLQSQIAAAPGMINSLNSDLKTKCETFRHLERLQLLVPAYAASLAESVRRRLFTKNLGTSSSAYAEMFSNFSNEERRRRGIYQAEWAGKLPWELPGLDEGLAFIEVEMRSSHSSLNSVKQNEPQATMEDLEALEQVLLEMQDNLSPEDMPSVNLPHPVQETTTLIKKLKKNIEKLTLSFEKLNRKLDDAEQSPTTSLSVSNGTSEAFQALEEKRTQLERDLQAERTAREAEVTALNVKNSELERLLAEHEEQKTSLAAKHKADQDNMIEDHNSRTNDLQVEIDRLTERAAHLAGENTMHASEASHLRQQLQDAQEDTEDLRKRLSEEELRSDHLEKRKHDLLQSLNEKDRLLRDHRTESELDRATLEKELAEAREKLDALERESSTQIASLQHDIERNREKVSAQENDYAELQTMCDERGRSISTMRSEAQATNAKILTLLRLCQMFYSQCEGFLVQFVREEVPKAPASGTSATISRMKAPAAQFQPETYQSFNAASLDSAINSLQEGRSKDLWQLAKAQCDYCISETKNWQKQCKRYKERMDKAIAASKDKIAFRSFHSTDLALFLPTKNASERVFAAFNFGKPNHFLKPTGRLIEDVESKEWIVARITSITEGVAEATEGIGNNPYLLRPGSKYCMLEAEFWPSSSNRRTSRTISSSDKKVTSPGIEEEANKADNNADETSPDGAFLSAPANLSTSPSELPKDGGPHKEENPISPDQQERETDSLEKRDATTTGQPPNTMDFSAFTVVRESEEPVTRSTLKPAIPSGASSLSSSRPKDLPILPESPIPPMPEAVQTGQADVGSLDVTDEEPAFLPRTAPGGKSIPTSSNPQVIPRSSLTASKQHPSAFSRSFGSSNGSGGSSGFRNRLSSSSFLTPSKGPATVAASPAGISSYLSQRSTSSSSPPLAISTSADRTSSRYTQTVGRYTGRNMRNQVGDGQHARQASASGASLPQSSARDLLRSFTAGQGSGT